MRILRLIILTSLCISKLKAQTGCPEGYKEGNNLIINSDFESGFNGFFTTYKATKSKEWFAGSIYVTNDPASVHNNYRLCLDSAYKNMGAMLVVDGSQNRSDIIWQQKINLSPRTEYYFGFFFATLLKPNPAQLEITFNDKRLTKTFDYHYQHCRGSIFFSYWNSESATFADIKIRSQTTEVMGNDFVLDNIRMFSCLKKEPEPVIIKQDSVLFSIVVKGRNETPVRNARISFLKLSDSLKVSRTTDSTGVASAELKKEKYEVTVHATDYFYLIDTVFPEGQAFSRVYTLTALDSGTVFTLKNLVFDKASSELTPDNKEELQKVLSLLQENPLVSIQIHGHTDNVGDAVKNYDLSLERVTNVKNYLVERGIQAERIKGIGFGGTKPLVGFGKDDERKVNRRVEFVIVRKK